MVQYNGILALERMERAVWKVNDRVLRATAALENAELPYAVVGESAVAAGAEQIDEAAVRATPELAARLKELPDNPEG